MDAEAMSYLLILLGVLAWPCIQYKVNELREKRYQKWYRHNVMMEEWKDV